MSTRGISIDVNPDDEEEIIISIGAGECVLWRGRDIGTLELVTAVVEGLGYKVEDNTL